MPAHLCLWTPDVTALYGGTCALAPPPNDFSFLMVIYQSYLLLFNIRFLYMNLS